MADSIKLVFDLLAFTSVIVLIVLGLGVIASMMGIFNFAHGEFVLLGAYTLFLFQDNGLPTWAGLIAAPIVVALVGLALEVLIIRRFYAAPIIAMLGTFAIGLVIREVVRGLLGGHYKSIAEPVAGAITVGGLQFLAEHGHVQRRGLAERLGQPQPVEQRQARVAVPGPAVD